MTRSVMRTVTTAVFSFCQLSAGSADGTAAPQLDVAIAARAIQPGEVVRIDINCRCSMPLERVKAEVFGREIAFARSGQSWRGLVGIDLAVRPGPHIVTIDAAGTGLPALAATETLRVIPKRFPTRRLRVAPEFVEPSPAAFERIARENTRIEAVMQAVSAGIWDGIVLQPVDAIAIGNFGSRSFFNGQPRAPHGGIDFSAGTGTPVKAPSAGRVVLVDDLFFTGNTIIIDHGQGLYSLFAHLSQAGVKVGTDVTPGEIVGLVGATGRVTGPHLHWSVRLDGARVDPLSLAALAARGESPTAFGRRCIPAGCVAPPSNIPVILGSRALPAGRIPGLDATPDFHHGLLGRDGGSQPTRLSRRQPRRTQLAPDRSPLPIRGGRDREALRARGVDKNPLRPSSAGRR